MTSTAEQTDTDIIIVGAGLVGALGALLLAQAGYRVIVVERANDGGARADNPAMHGAEPGVDIARLPLRHVALSPASVALLEPVGAWPVPDTATFSAVHVWEEQGTAALRLTASQVQRVELGWVSQHDWVLQRLLQ